MSQRSRHRPSPARELRRVRPGSPKIGRVTTRDGTGTDWEREGDKILDPCSHPIRGFPFLFRYQIALVFLGAFSWYLIDTLADSPHQPMLQRLGW